MGPRTLRRKILDSGCKRRPGRPPAPWARCWIAEGLTLPHAVKRWRAGAARRAALWPLSREPNDEWAADFKGWIRTGDGERVDPLTISDRCSRYLLRCQAVEKMDTQRVQAIFEAAFREYGMPLVIRSDNGAPFTSGAGGGLVASGVVVDQAGDCAPGESEPGHPNRTVA